MPAAPPTRPRHSAVAARRSQVGTDLVTGTPFLGPTSFAAVFTENRENLDPLPTPDQSTTANSVIDGYHHSYDTRGYIDVVEDSFIHLGAKVLDQIPDRETIRGLVRELMHPNDGFVRPLRLLMSHEIWDVWDDQLDLRLGRRHVELSRALFENTASVLRDSDDLIKWGDSFSGRNMRWETIGILFTYWAFGATCSSDTDPHITSQRPPHNDRRQLTLDLKDCASTCITLCNAVDANNPLFVHLLYKHMLLESIIEGDASPLVWRQHGDLVAVTLSCGLHRFTDSKINASNEMRRRVYASVFNIDKVISAFVGRPPLLSGRYSSTPLPLDLDDDDLLATGPELDAAVANLDADGWNSDGKMHGCTLLRARTQQAYIRDKILELALGTATERLVEQAL